MIVLPEFKSTVVETKEAAAAAEVRTAVRTAALPTVAGKTYENADQYKEAQLVRLTALETKIKLEMKSFLTLGELLNSIQFDSLYKVAGFDTFDAYCQSTFDLIKSTVSRYISAYKLSLVLADCSTQPSNEGQYRELNDKDLTPAEIKEVWETIASTKKVTACIIKEAVQIYKGIEVPVAATEATAVVHKPVSRPVHRPVVIDDGATEATTTLAINDAIKNTIEPTVTATVTEDVTNDLKAELEALKALNATLVNKNTALENQNTELKNENTELKNQNTELKTELKKVVATQELALQAASTDPIEVPVISTEASGTVQESTPVVDSEEDSVVASEGVATEVTPEVKTGIKTEVKLDLFGRPYPTLEELQERKERELELRRAEQELNY